MAAHVVASHLRGLSAAARCGAVFAALVLASLAVDTPLAGLLHTGNAMAAETPARAAQERKPAARKKTRAARDSPFGREGDPRKVTRVINIDTSDTMRYFPDHVTVKKGQTVRFQVRNAGQLPHEMVLGTMDDLKKHAALMKKNGDVDYEEPNVARVEPGESGRIVWQFTRAGEFYFGCLVPGHFEAGMIGTIVVR
jgi:uncharacterized cupredoxin-like copper-binding protein